MRIDTNLKKKIHILIFFFKALRSWLLKKVGVVGDKSRFRVCLRGGSFELLADNPLIHCLG